MVETWARVETSGRLCFLVEIGYCISRALWKVAALGAIDKAKRLDRTDTSGRV